MQVLIHGRNPAVVCIQKTHLCPSHALHHRDFTTQSYGHPAGEKASGGTSVIVMNATAVYQSAFCAVAGHRCARAPIQPPLHLTQYLPAISNNCTSTDLANYHRHSGGFLYVWAEE
jgi:hypothetical protein